MKFILFLLLAFGIHACYSQTTDSAAKYDPNKDTAFYAQKECEITATYPGGPKNWEYFVDKNLFNLNETAEKVIVSVQFRVDRQGKVSNIEVVSGPSKGGFGKEAMRLVKKSGIWMPAVSRGHQVNAFRTVEIAFPVVPNG
jgi:TonB family protein